MLMTVRKPTSVGEMLVEEFLTPSGLTPGRAGRGDGGAA